MLPIFVVELIDRYFKWAISWLKVFWIQHLTLNLGYNSRQLLRKLETICDNIMITMFL